MRPIYVLLPSLLLLILSGCDLSSSSDSGSSGTDSTGVDPTEQIPNAATDWLKENGHALDTTDPESNLDDLEPLRQIVGDARVVSLGEATHGTSEFFRMKHRILRFLVKEMGFTAFAIEASMPASFKVNEHVQAGTGNPDERLEGLDFWIWNTQEVLNQIRWMRNYNQAQDPDIGFYGFDPRSPKKAMEVVVNFTEDVDPEAAETVQDHYSCFRRNTPDYYEAPDSTQQRCREGVEAVSELLDEKRGAYISRTSEHEFSFARQHARLVAQIERKGRLNAGRVRDTAMARNVQWLLDYLGPDSKIVLWAHNGHVSEVGVQYPSTSMGAHLDEELGANLVSIGFSFLEGRANAIDRRIEALNMPPPPDSSPTSYYEYYFASADASPFLMDLRIAQKGTDESGWLYGPKKIRAVGSTYDPEQPLEDFYETNLVSEFDAMIYIEQSTPSDLLRFD
jgi:erythromycin esterase